MIISTIQLPDGRFVEVEHEEGATEAEILQLGKEQATQEGASLARSGAGIATEVAIGEGLKWGMATAGSFAGPIGSGVGYLAGGVIGGISGSIARQRIQNPTKDLSWGQIVGDTILNLIPLGGGKVAKIGQVVAKGATVGAGVGAGAVSVESIIDEGRLPTISELASAGITGAAVGAGFGLSGRAFTGAYSRFAGMKSSSISDAFHRGDPDAAAMVNGATSNSEGFLNARMKVSKDFVEKMRTNFDNEFYHAGKLQKTVGGGQYTNKDGLFDITEDSDLINALRVSPGRKDAAMGNVDKMLNKDKQLVFAYAKRLGTSPDKVHVEIDDYLRAKHAPSYNKQHGDGAAGVGFTTKEANAKVADFEARGLDKEYVESITIRRGLSSRILDTYVAGGTVSQAQADLLRIKNPDYVPMQRIIDPTDPLSARFSDTYGREAKTSGLKAAKGSDLDADITKNITNNLLASIETSETNFANRHLLAMLRNNPSVAKENGFVIRKAIKKGKRAGKPGARPKDSPRRGVFTPSRENPDGHLLSVFEGGEKYFIDFSDTQHMAALAGIKGVNKKALGPVLQTTSKINRFLGSIYTKYNPSFIAPNLVRDRVESFINASAKMPLREAAKLLSPRAIKEELGTIKRAVFNKQATTPREIELDTMYKEFKDAGGSTGGLAMTTIEDIQAQIKKIDFKQSHPAKTRAKAANKWVNNVNEIVEDGTRFATYRRARNSGMSKPQAALAARDSSFDPALKGVMGDQMKALYLFSNPSVQGTKNIFRSVFKSKNSKNIQIGLGASLLGLSVSTDMWNSFIDPDWRDKVKGGADGSAWRLNKNFVLLSPFGKEDGSLDYAQFPLPYPIVPIKTAIDGMYRGITGRGGENLPAEVLKEVINGYNPTGGSLLPTVLDKLLQATSTNKDGLGRDIVPAHLLEQNLSAAEKVFPWTANTVGGEMAISLSEELQNMGAEVSPEKLLFLYNNAFGGAGADTERLFTMVSKVFNGEKITNNDAPIWRRFFGTTYADSFVERTGIEVDLDLFDYEQKTISARSGRQAFNIFNRIKPKAGEQVNPNVYETALRGSTASVKRRVDGMLKDRFLGLTKTDKQIRSLGVTNGARSEFYISQLEKMPQDKAQMFIQDQRKKRLITATVEKQMASRRAFKEMLN